MTEPDKRAKEYEERSSSSNKPAPQAGSEQREILESILDCTQHLGEDEALFPLIVEYVRRRQLNEPFGFGVVSELVQFVIAHRFRRQLSEDARVEAAEFVANALYGDPLARSHLEKLWSSVCKSV
jgi:hypothetical protein